MPILKKLIRIGRYSRGITLPSEWLDYYEREGEELLSVVLEVSNDRIIISPGEVGKPIRPKSVQASPYHRPNQTN